MLRTIFELAVIAAVAVAAETEPERYELEKSVVLTDDGWSLPLVYVKPLAKLEADAGTGEDAEDAGDAGEAVDAGEQGGDGDEQAGDGNGETPQEDVDDGEEGDEDPQNNRRRLSAPVEEVVVLRDRNAETPILVLTPEGMSADDMLDDSKFPIQIWREGFEVFVGSFRTSAAATCEKTVTDDQGVESTEDCAGTALQSWATAGEKDLPALVAEVRKKVDAGRQAAAESEGKSYTPGGKISIIGLYDSASAAAYGLAKDEGMRGSLERSILMAPCIFKSQDSPLEEHMIWTQQRDALGIFRTTPENIDSHHEMICETADEDDLTEEVKTVLDTWCTQFTDWLNEGFDQDIEWGSEDYWFQLATAETFQEPIATADYVDPWTSEAVPIGGIRAPEVQIFVGVDDEVCPPAQAKRLYDGLTGLGEAGRSLNIIEFVDAKNKDGDRMGHEQWTETLSVALRDQVIRAVEEGASHLMSATLAIASVAALSLY